MCRNIQAFVCYSLVFYAKVIQAQKKAGDFMKHIKNTWELFILDWKRIFKKPSSNIFDCCLNDYSIIICMV